MQASLKFGISALLPAHYHTGPSATFTVITIFRPLRARAHGGASGQREGKESEVFAKGGVSLLRAASRC